MALVHCVLCVPVLRHPPNATQQHNPLAADNQDKIEKCRYSEIVTKRGLRFYYAVDSAHEIIPVCRQIVGDKGMRD